MSMIWSIVWGILTAAVMLITMKYYMPRLLKRIQVGHSDSSLDSEQTEEIVPKDLLGKHRIGAIILLILCGCFAGWCGYVAGGHGIPLINTWKMTITSLVESNKGRPGHGRCKTVQYTWVPVWDLRITVYVIVFVCIVCACIHRPVDHKEKAFEGCTADGTVYLAGIPCGSIIDTDIGKVNRNETVNVNYNMLSRADGIWMDVRIHVNRR